MHNFRASNEETDLKIGMYSKNWVEQAIFENFDFLVKVQVLLSQSFFFFFFFLFNFFLRAVWTGSGWMGQTGSAWTNGSDCSGIWRHAWRHGTEGSCQHLARVARWRVERVTYPSQCVRHVRGPRRRVGAREMMLVITRLSGGAWRRVSGLLDLKFSGLVDLRPWKTLVLLVFLKLWADLHSFEGLSRQSSRVYGGAWRHVRPFLGLQFLGFVDRGPMDRVVASIL